MQLIFPGTLDYPKMLTPSMESISAKIGDVVLFAGDKVVVDDISFDYLNGYTIVTLREPPANENHDDQTLHKVYDALRRTGLTPIQCKDAVNNMQNEGILFRERKAD